MMAAANPRLSWSGFSVPMVRSAKDVLRVRRFYEEYIIAEQDRKLGDDDITIREWLGEFGPKEIRVTPLVEDKESILSSHEIARELIRADGGKHKSMRFWYARSDPALNYGNPAEPHSTEGYPGLPNQSKDNLTYEGMYYRWVERVWKSGLRLMVMGVNENRVLCELQANRVESCNEMDTNDPTEAERCSGPPLRPRRQPRVRHVERQGAAVAERGPAAGHPHRLRGGSPASPRRNRR